jgi:hypothetical protein
MAKTSTPRKTTFMPVTTMEEVPVLSDEEKAELLESLKQAQSEIAAGDYDEFKPGEVGPWLRRQLEAARRRHKKA